MKEKGANEHPIPISTSKIPYSFDPCIGPLLLHMPLRSSSQLHWRRSWNKSLPRPFYRGFTPSQQLRGVQKILWLSGIRKMKLQFPTRLQIVGIPPVIDNIQFWYGVMEKLINIIIALQDSMIPRFSITKLIRSRCGSTRRLSKSRSQTNHKKNAIQSCNNYRQQRSFINNSVVFHSCTHKL